MQLAYKKAMYLILVFIIICKSFIPVNSYAIVPKSSFSDRYAEIVIDANSGKTLFSANENARRYPASLTKMMTLYLLFSALQEGRLSPNTPLPVSAYAANRPPTKIGFIAGQTISAQDAAKAIIVKSANDVAVAVGEYLGGTEHKFAAMMTVEAHRLGMMNTHFANASGLPDNDNYTTARDLATLALSLRRHFPNLYYLFKTTSLHLSGRYIRGHNKLLKSMQGVDGIKTGYTQMSGYNLATSYYANGKNLVAIIMGSRSALLRDTRMAVLLHKFIPQAKSIEPSKNIQNRNQHIPMPTLKNGRPLALVSALQTTAQSSSYAIQIGATSSLTAAMAIYRKAVKENKALFIHTKQQISSVIKNKKKYYRVRITNLTDKATSDRACKILKKEKFNCYIIHTK